MHTHERSKRQKTCERRKEIPSTIKRTTPAETRQEKEGNYKRRTRILKKGTTVAEGGDIQEEGRTHYQGHQSRDIDKRRDLYKRRESGDYTETHKMGPGVARRKITCKGDHHRQRGKRTYKPSTPTAVQITYKHLGHPIKEYIRGMPTEG